ncbi:MAG: hypothetical protein IJQ42_01840 [Oscillospiraceae bacterium]|nr:hypothetical protein [Oscillospiraceae bacterium]
MNSNELRDYYIAYFDILGYKSFFDDKENDVFEFLDNVINVCNETLHKTGFNEQALQTQFKVKSFSDNFIIMLEANENSSDYMVLKMYSRILSQLQIHFLEKYQILIRGGITKGKAYIDENIVFGNGLIRAVTLESTATFPRIIIDRECFGEQICVNLCEMNSCLAKDEDDEFYVDYFCVDCLNSNSKRIDVIRKNVIRLVRKHGKYRRDIKDPKKIFEAEKTISKYAWLLCKFNKKCIEDYKVTEIPYRLVFYYRTMKTEIQIL